MREADSRKILQQTEGGSNKVALERGQSQKNSVREEPNLTEGAADLTAASMPGVESWCRIWFTPASKSVARGRSL
jgi:hypothetical protein